MRRASIWEQADDNGGTSDYEDARSVLNTRSNSTVSLWSTDEEGFHTPTSTLSRASSIRSTSSRPTSGLMQRRYQAYQSGQSPAWDNGSIVRASLTGTMAGQDEPVRNPWTDWASQGASVQNSMAASQINFQPLRLSAAGEHEADPVIMTRSRITTSDAYQAARVSSPHAAAATRRFLAVNTSTSRAAGANRLNQSAASHPASPSRAQHTARKEQQPVAAPLRTDAPTPMPLFSAGAATPFNAPVFSGNTGPSAFLGGQEGSSAAAEPTLRPTSRPTPGKANRALDHLHSGSESPGGWHIPAAPGQGVNGAAKMGRREAWARFLAYDAAVQLCIMASRKGVAAAGSFLDNFCTALRRAMNLEGLLLNPAPPGGDPCGATLWWDDSESAALPAVGFGPVLRREEGVRCAVHRLQCSAVYKPLLARAGNLPHPLLYVSLRPARWTGEASWTSITDDGRGGAGEPVDLSQDDKDDDIVIELHTDVGQVAKAVVKIADIWAIASDGPVLEPRPSQVERQRWCIFRCRRPPANEDIWGKKWVTLTDAAGTRYAHVQLSAWTSSTEKTVIAAADAPEALPELSNEASSGAASKGFQQITGWQIYDLLLEAALEAQQCGPRRLQVTDQWEWLLNEFAETYGIRDTYAKLAHLRWVVRKENVSLTAYCFSLLEKDLEQLKRVQAVGSLLPMEVKLLERIELACEEQLAATFENYSSLSEDSPSGLAENGAPMAEQPAPALRPAVGLCKVLKDVLSPSDHIWFQERFQEAAIKRYGRLQAACNEAVNSDNMRRNRRTTTTAEAPRAMPAHRGGPLGDIAPGHDHGGSAEAELAYARLEALCQAVKVELQQDLHIHDAAVLPNFVNLPKIAAAEYGRMLIMDLTHALELYPPPQPTRAAVDLLVTVGKHQEYLVTHSLLPPHDHPGYLDALKVFGKHVHRWIETSQAGLCMRCQQIEASGYATAMLADHAKEGRTFVAPLVDEMLQRIAAEVARYERVITYWPVFGPALEGAVCASLRETTASVTRQCGLAQVRLDGRPGAKHDERSSPNRWRWNAALAATGPGRLTVLPHEAVLLNSVRRLLSVVPQTEHTISTWASGPAVQAASASPHSASESPGRGRGADMQMPDGPEMGAQFAQLVKELRSEYGGAVQACAFRISQGVTIQANASLKQILEQHGITGTPTLLQQLTGPMLERVEEVVLGLTRLLDARVYVALGRGLWDFTAKDVYDYVESLQEDRHNKGAWKGRQNAAAALDVVDNFYSALLSSTLQHDIQDKDLDLPLHSDRTHRLLEPNTAAINMSYTVF